VSAQRLEELDVLLFLDRAFVQAEQKVRSTQHPILAKYRHNA
jgi:hypothetical protein